MGAAPKAELLAPAGRRNQTRAAPALSAGTCRPSGLAIAVGIKPASATRPNNIDTEARSLRTVILLLKAARRFCRLYHPDECWRTAALEPASDGLADCSSRHRG